MADDPVRVDSGHYRVESENDRVRVVRVRYGPHEKSVMHTDPAGVVIFLTEHHVRFTLPDGTHFELHARPGEVLWGEGETHLPENLEDSPFELLLIQVKGQVSRSDGGRPEG